MSDKPESAPAEEQPTVELADLIARDPRQMSDEEFMILIEKLREARRHYVKGDKKAGSTKPKSAAQKKVSALAAIKTDIQL